MMSRGLSKLFIVRSTALVVMLMLILFTASWDVQAQGGGGDDPLSALNAEQISKSTDFSNLVAKLQANDTVRVIIGLKQSFQPMGTLSTEQAQAQVDGIASAQDNLLSTFAGYNLAHITRLHYVPYLAGNVDERTLAALLASPQVTSVNEDVMLQVTLWNSIPYIGADTAWGMGYTGSGWTVAILDTGVQSDHPFVNGKVVSEACYSGAGGYSTSVCPGGVYQLTGSGSAMPYSSGVCPSGKCDHGTHVAGIAAGKNGSYNGHTNFSGVAKDATIIAIQVFSKTGSSSVGAYTSDINLGLERVYALRSTYSIASVNLSLGGSTMYNDYCDSSWSSTKSDIDNLRSAGIATVIASGNNYSSSGISAPGCISSAISVGATDNSDTIASFSNNTNSSSPHPMPRLLAPGVGITSSIPYTGYANWDGTSMATPHVTGAWAVLKQKSPGATVDQILAAFQNTGVSDYGNGGYGPFKRIRVDQALSQFGPSSPTPIAPSGTISSRTPTFQWSRVSEAVYYHLYVRKGSTVIVDDDTITPTDASCDSSGPCSYTPGGTWDYGDYSWTVAAEDSTNAWSSWASTTNFTITIAATTITSPTGSSSNWKPTYTWDEVTDATQYYLYVYNSSSTAISQWYTVGSGGLTCGSGTCTITPDVELGSGSYTWEVRTKNGSGLMGPWSNTLSFTTPAAPSSVTTLNSPITTSSSWKPQYSWQEPSGAPVTKYYLYVYNSSGSAISQWYTVGSGGLACSSGTCTITPDVELGSGSYSWMVRAGNPSGMSASWSPTQNFSTPPAPNNVVTLNAPTGSIATWTPQYSWTASVSDGSHGAATKYYLYVYSGSTAAISQWYTVGSGGLDCSGGTCTITPSVTLGVGTYTWMVRAGNPTGMSAGWSGTLSFTTPSNIPGAATPTSPTGSASNWKPTYTWTEPGGPATATKYYLYVYNSSSTPISQWYTVGSGGLACSSGTCTVTPDVELGAGSYTWMVRSGNANGMGPWSSTLSFTTPPAPNNVVTLNAPTGTITTWTPQYSWTASVSDGSHGAATKYYLYVYIGSTVAISQWYTVGSGGLDCTGGNCTLTPSVTLGAGTYSWMVRAGNPSGNSAAWSGVTTFTTPAAPSSAPTLVKPISYLHPADADQHHPTYEWTKVSGATKYYVYVYLGSTVYISRWVNVGDLTDLGSDYSYQPSDVSLPNGVLSWMIRPGNPSGMAPWSVTEHFTVGP